MADGMLRIVSRFPRKPNAAYPVRVADRLSLPFERREKSRQRAVLASGEEVAIELPRGQVLRGGDWVVAADGRVIEVVASPERVLHVECDTPEALARVAYHLGNRHVPVQVGPGWLRIADDHVLARMFEALGARYSALEAPFEPEAGAYAGAHHHHHHDDESVHGGRIHDFASPRAPHGGDGPGPNS